MNPKHKLGNTRYRFDIQHYKDQELIRALSLACFEVGSIPKTELIRFTARFLGFSRVTKRITFRLEALISKAIRGKYLREDGNRYLPGDQARGDISPYVPASATCLPPAGRQWFCRCRLRQKALLSDPSPSSKPSGKYTSKKVNLDNPL